MAALAALENVRHPDVRHLALRLMQTPNELAARAVAVLDRNYEAGDDGRVLALAEELVEPEAIHAYGFDAVDFFQNHPNSEAETHLHLFLYENDPCSFCREKSVERLLALGNWPVDLAAECEFDANLEIRKLVRDHTDGLVATDDP